MAHRFSGRRICEHRQRLGWRPEQLACRINRSSVTVRQYEHGHVTPNADMVAALADALEVDPADLFEEVAP